ncbi:MAG TPA: hypothetical protein VGK90_09995 [Rhizomicrobium sp.]
MKILLAGILGGIVMFIWTSVAHMALPLGHIGFSGIPDEAPVLASMQKAIGGQTGLYFFPWVDPRQSNAMAEETAKLKTNPSGLLIYRPPGGGGMTGAMLITEFLKEVVVSLIAAFLLARTILVAYPARAGFVALVGLAATLTTNMSYWNWYGFPTDYTLAAMITEFVGYLVAGLAKAAILPRSRTFGAA